MSITVILLGAVVLTGGLLMVFSLVFRRRVASVSNPPRADTTAELDVLAAERERHQRALQRELDLLTRGGRR